MEFCSPSMSSYFENNAEKKKGCTRGELNESLTGPRFPTQPQCIIYSNDDDNTHNLLEKWQMIFIFIIDTVNSNSFTTNMSITFNDYIYLTDYNINI